MPGGRETTVRVPVKGPGVACELRFDARWISGSPQLIAETWDGSVSHSLLLEVPTRLGTPGRTNSRARPEPARVVAQIGYFIHKLG